MCGVGIEFRFWENKLLPAIRQQTFLWQIESRQKPIQIPSPPPFWGAGRVCGRGHGPGRSLNCTAIARRPAYP